ncbi:MAG: hypothetical protein IPP63_03800 [Chloracidobacterium sp.]|nr:hypothetical protein [Chloracidobacterium sp.]
MSFSIHVDSKNGIDEDSIYRTFDPRTAATPACHLAQAYPATTSGITQTGTRIFVIATEGVMNAGTFTGAAGWGPHL